MKAGIAEAKNISPSPTPTISGAWSRVPTTISGSSAETAHKCVVAVQKADRLADRSGEAAADALLDEMRDHLGVCLAGERMTALRELGAQLLVVLDDAVEHDGHAPRAVVVRVGVLVAGPAVRRPARVAEPDRGLRRSLSAARREQRVQVADGAHRLEAAVLHEDDACRVVAAVLKPLQAVEDDGLARASPGVAYDAAHACSLLRVSRRRAGCGRHLRAALFRRRRRVLTTRYRPCRAGRHPPSLSMNLHLVTRAGSPLAGLRARARRSGCSSGVRAAGLLYAGYSTAPSGGPTGESPCSAKCRSKARHSRMPSRRMTSKLTQSTRLRLRRSATRRASTARS